MEGEQVMLLQTVVENNGWILSKWKLSYRVDFEQICKLIEFIYNDFQDVQIKADNQLIDITNHKELRKYDESDSLCIRGYLSSLKMPVMITLHVQKNNVEVYCMKPKELTKPVTYEFFNLKMCGYMDVAELSMYI